MNQLHDWLNDLSDDDRFWGRLLFLRPAPAQLFTPQRTLAIAVLHGLLWGMVGNVLFAAIAWLNGTRVPPLVVLPLIYVLVIYVALRLTLARAWNHRAARLARKAELCRQPSKVGPDAAAQDE